MPTACEMIVRLTIRGMVRITLTNAAQLSKP